MAATENRNVNVFINSQVKGDASIKQLKAEYRILSNQIAKLPRDSKEYRLEVAKLKQVSGELANHRNKIRGIDTAWGQAKQNLTLIKGVAIAAIGTALVSAFRNAAESVKEFQTASAELQAITGVTDEALEGLQLSARNLAGSVDEDGVRITASASEILEAFKKVGSAKPELLSSAAGMEEVTKQAIILSEASGQDLDTSIKVLTGTLNQFDKGAGDAASVVDTLAAGAKFGAGEVDFLGEAIVKSGTAMNAANVPLNQGVAVLELFAEKGLTAETAGTGFRNVLLILQQDTENYTDGVFDMNKALDRLSSRQGDNIGLLKEFGRENVSSALILAKGTERVAELTEQLKEQGVASQQAAINSDTLSKKQEALGSQYEAFILGLENGTGPISQFFGGLIEGASKALEMLTRLNKSQKELNDERRGDVERLRLQQAENSALTDVEDFKKRLEERGEVIKSSSGAAQRFLEAEYLTRKRLLANGDQLDEQSLAFQLELNKRRIQAIEGANNLKTGLEPSTSTGGGTSTGPDEKELDRQRAAAEKIAAQVAAQAEKDLEAEKKRQEEFRQARIDFEDELYLDTLDAKDRELVLEMQKWDEKFALAEQFAIDTTNLTELQNAAIAAINEKYRQEGSDADAEANQERIAAAHLAADQYASIGNNFIATLSMMSEGGAQAAGFQKSLAIFDIALNQGVAIAKGIASIKGLTGIDYLVQLAGITASVAAAFAGIKKTLSSAEPPSPPKFRQGVIGFGGGQAIVGEDGPELVNLPTGSDVLSATASRRIGLGITMPTPDTSITAGRSAGRSTLQDEEFMSLMKGFLKAQSARTDGSSVAAGSAQAPQVIQAVVSHKQFDESAARKKRIESIAYLGGSRASA